MKSRAQLIVEAALAASQNKQEQVFGDNGHSISYVHQENSADNSILTSQNNLSSNAKTLDFSGLSAHQTQDNEGSHPDETEEMEMSGAEHYSSFSEDDDDNVKDKNFDYSSASTSSSDSSSTITSTSSSSGCREPHPGISSSNYLPQSINNEAEVDINNVILKSSENVIQEIADATETKKTKKRVRKETEWMKQKTKILRNAGMEYISCGKTKKKISAKKMKTPCGDKCKYKCCSKITPDQRLEIFNEFYSLKDINRKREFISRNMEYVKPRYRYPQPGNRRLNNSFHFQVEQTKIRVCKLFFKATLDINDRTIDTVIKKRTSTGSVSDDNRGKHGKHRRLGDDIKNGIRKHINSIPKIESHYLRAQTSKEFIEGGKTIADLHRDYKLQCETNGKTSGNYHLYSDIFNTEYNISFFTPKKDQCNLCYVYHNANADEKEKLKPEYERHQTEKKLSRIEKENDKKKCSKNFIVACFDMQAVFQTPKGDLSIFYYKSKLNTMNLTVTGLSDGDTSCFVRHEGEGGKGATEIGSCILLYLQDKAETCDSDDLEITLYSDNCVAQQKNRFLIAAFMYAVQKYKIKQITHKFLVMGHTQNEGDSTHSTIEKHVSRSLKSGPIFVPDQFIAMIRAARKKGTPYHVKELTHENFYNVKQLMTDLEPNFNINTDGEQVVINDLRVIKVEKEQPFKFFYKTSFSDSHFKTVNVQQRQRRSRSKSSDLPTLPTLVTAYNCKRPLNENKITDLKFMLEKNYIPKYYAPFYNSLW